MFEKEAIKWVRTNSGYSTKEFHGHKAIEAYLAGAEFGYNKANEWHYMKDGIMPEENQWVLVYDGSYTVCNYHSYAPIKWLDSYENEVYEGYIIAWKEITPPKEIKENEN